MTAATTTYASFPCPDCHKLIGTEGRDIHLCTTRLMDGRKVLEVSREYVGYYDSYRVCGKSDNHAVEIELDRYVADLQSSGLDRPEPTAPALPDEPINRRVAGFMTGECPDCGTVQRLAFDGVSWACDDPCACAARQHSGQPPAQPTLPDEPPAPAAPTAPPRPPVDPNGIMPVHGSVSIGPVRRDIAPPAVPIPVAELHALRGRDTAAFRARLASLSAAELDREAPIYAAYESLVSGKVVSADQTRDYFRSQVALHHSGAVPQATSDDLSPVLAELALTDIPALAELLRAHTESQRQQLAWRYAAWLRRKHDITREPEFIQRGWDLLLVGDGHATDYTTEARR